MGWGGGQGVEGKVGGWGDRRGFGVVGVMGGGLVWWG